MRYNGRDFSDFGVHVDESKAFGSPEKDYELIEVVGRNGNLSIYNDRFKDIVLSFPCFIRSGFIEKYRNLLAYLNSLNGYQRLETEKEPNHFRKALFTGSVDVQTTPWNQGGFFTINFSALPQRFLKSGENWTTVSSSSSEISGNPVSISNPSGLTALTGLSVDIEPVQDLNGYDHPWVGGAGKNKLPSHAVGSTTTNGVTFTVRADGSIALSGTATARTDFVISTFNVPNTSLAISGAPSGGSAKWNLRIDLTASGEANQCYDDGSATASRTMNTAVGTQVKAVIRVYSGINVDGLVFYPMLRLASVTDDTYEPYSNICPITGHTSATVTRTVDGTATDYTINLNGTVYGGTLDVLTGVLTVDTKFMTFNGTEAWETINIGFRCALTDRGVPRSAKQKSNWLTGSTSSDPDPTTTRNYKFNCGSLINVGGIASSLAKFKSLLASQPLQICYELSTPQTVQLTAQQVSLLTGTNIFSANTGGDITVTTSDPFTLDNPSYMKAKPVFKVKVPSKVSVNGTQVIDAFGMLDWAETPITHGELTWQVFDGYVRIQGTQSTDFERYIAYLTVPPGTYSIKLNGGDYRSLVQLKIDDGTTEESAFINTDYTFTATEKTEYVLSIFIQSHTQVNDDFTLTFDGQTEYMYINSELMDAYYEDGKNANPYVELTDGYIELPSGETYITVEGEAEIKPMWWRL